MAFVSCVSSTFFQPARSGSHLYSANRNTLRSGHGAKVLLTLVGTRSLGRLALSFCTLIVSHFKGFVKRFFTFFFEGCFVLHFRFRYSLPVCPLLLTPLLYHNLGDLSRGFLHFLRTFFSGAPTPVLHSQWQAFVCGYPLPLTMIVYHTSPQKSTWQNAQIRASKLFDFCTTFFLTNCWRYGIMEIPAPTSEGAAPKN